MDGISSSLRMGSRLYLAVLAVLMLSSSPAHSFWWKYGSMAEAEVACNKWAGGRGTFRYRFQMNMGFDYSTFETKYQESTGTVSIRDCGHEEKTNQFLGYEYPYKEGFLLEDAPWGDGKVVKRFRY